MAEERPDLFDDAPWDETPDPEELANPFRGRPEAHGPPLDTTEGDRPASPRVFWKSFLVVTMAGVGFALLGGVLLVRSRKSILGDWGPYALLGFGVAVIIFAAAGAVARTLRGVRHRGQEVE